VRGCVRADRAVRTARRRRRTSTNIRLRQASVPLTVFATAQAPA
jgi:hypothetical protein